MLYFAYGSNLNRRAMARRCPRALPLSTASLAGFRLVFRRFADMIPDPQGSLQGALYRLTPACLHALDAYEDAPRLYRRITVSVTADGALHQACAYIMNESAVAPPTLAYYGEIARGYQDWKLDQTPLRRARIATTLPQPPIKTPRTMPDPEAFVARERR